MDCCGARRGSGSNPVPAVGQAGTEGPEGACLASLISLEGPALPQPASRSCWHGDLGSNGELFASAFFLCVWLFQYFTVAMGRSAVLAPVGWAWLSGLGQLLLGLQITHLENEELG